MRLPTATYRLQLREGMDFAAARDLVPYLDDLGVSHLYLSPIFTAAPGSTHGYDIIDMNEVDPSLGGRDGLVSMSDALRARGMGLILDIVPNHMAFAVQNVWLRDVLRHGEKSAFAHHFDIDWSAEYLPLPWLPAPFAAMVDAGEIGIDGDEMVAGDLRVPLATEASADLVETHEAQSWRLTFWKTEAATIAHRRFFTVTGLIGLRIEDRPVFEDVHRLVFDLVDADIVQGLRVDHVDGLADPGAYLDRLHARLPGTPIWVEKILTGQEALPSWPVQGTTGYVAARAIARVLTDEDGAQALAQGLPDFPVVRDEAKVQIVTTELQAELERLTDLAAEAGRDLEWGAADWRSALIAYLRAFPRYRTYTTPDEIGAEDAALIRDVAERAAHPLAPAVGDLAGLLLDLAHRELRLRLQQVSGAAIAKAQEDTAFYRWTPLLSANEVGAEPDEPSMTPDEFHAAMQRREARMPHGLTLTSSHDTKRSEDARMRIAAISHGPEARGALMAQVPGLPEPWGWYLAQSAWAAAPDGDLAERLRAHLEKAMREAKAETFWTGPDEAFEEPILDAARRVAAEFDGAAPPLRDLARRAENLSLVQCALKLFIPGIPDIYQGTEVGNYRLTDPDNRAPVDWDRLRGLMDAPDLSTFDGRKFDLTRTLLRLRRSEPETFAAPWTPVPAPRGRLSARRGDLHLLATLDGTPLDDAASALWPPEGPSPVRLTRA
ncbi:malto-oligosyltrehalose synthase [Jannaschia aquimarina]|uniref:TreY protein n=1 Tax=Jannaschia aquimarina TaxID=935700 RepID=A0A0D1EKR2_9RHOB|nr:malto-oligosyltrehalose synthase [Jannaschia aquimarina]KIT17596.1 Maltooligosyl trehalose synthase [Jannaschia aquimarina]SNS71842.1 maltooligosyl trehalose synthase [Jannaschia aquimarina]